jgi:hypothetical protein
MEGLLSKEINIESQYPGSSYLFRCLLSPSGDPIAGLVHTITLINSSSKLEDISRLFQDISNSLKDVNASKAAHLLRPLRSRSIFPVSTTAEGREYNSLLDLHNADWFIADQPLIRTSFHGKLPLLALPVADLAAMENLFRILRLEGRKLSKIVTSQTVAKGQIKAHWAYTKALRSKTLFIEA